MLLVEPLIKPYLKLGLCWDFSGLIAKDFCFLLQFLWVWFLVSCNKVSYLD